MSTASNVDIKTPFTIQEKNVTQLAVKPLLFKDFVQLWRTVDPSSKKVDQAFRRKRMIHQTLVQSGKETIILTEEDISQLPIPVARAIIEKLDANTGDMGELISPEGADGTTVPIVYKLGTPIKMQSTKDGPKEIIELEFQALTYAEVEDILIADNTLEQAYGMLRIATPIGTPLMRLPEWAIDRITIGDGVGIMQKVVPVF